MVILTGVGLRVCEYSRGGRAGRVGRAVGPRDFLTSEIIPTKNADRFGIQMSFNARRRACVYLQYLHTGDAFDNLTQAYENE